MNYTITNVSKMTGLAPSAIRFYEQEGLLPYLQRKSSGTRFFTDDDIERLTFIIGLKDAGLTIREIQECFTFCDRGDETIDKRIQLFQKHKSNIRSKICELEKCIQRIDDKVTFLQQKKNTSSTISDI
ncbi:MAG: MerR family transcriptional regulator [Hespellia sp.]|nr:MerR family transcriptional regulator [Hespellia sp.]